MHRVAISGTGIFTPEEVITNAELVASYNEYAHRQNKLHADAIEAGERASMAMSSEEFIVKASGIERRHVVSKFGILDPGIMHPVLPERTEDELSLMAEISVKAADEALKKAGLTAADIDAVICAASNHERAYPAVAIEVQQALGIKGFAFDMNVACSSATFGIQLAADMIRTGSARAILMVNPEITSGHQEWRDRDCHFIFGDVCTAVVLQRADEVKADNAYEVLATRCLTEFSNNIRNNNGFLRRTREGHMADRRDMQFHQEGRKVFKQVVPMVAELMLSHLAEQGIAPADLSRLWLHQANKGMNDLIGSRVLGREPTREEQPNVLQDYANTSSAGSIIAFSKFSNDLPSGSLGVICSFGAGYSAGSVIVRKV
ncbi:beta-ketodecanoyl-[acyl-carrier-protein] synthase [Aminobacter aminovorans]|uniref:3-oxoacyl-[acyl-carrier-protein] synthase 3 n=1 Tax=Aminobacter aminovorans TaxID=83263 RepID=A0A380WQZ1_AMIAI|nr:beta-ketoacyl-ACP synthase III [Aminobacter aminovorans]TCS30528.1 beta-ketodecanoyl-[acyl-carrier-protein] synthase [Aminobacter aminovorans]SUU91377.1 3-oxoacyl-[acyl-carrier-protein] synthase 3 [Aminobacter aminovorans]